MKFVLNSRGLHLQEHGSSKLAKKFLNYVYWVCATGDGFPDQSEQSKFCIAKQLRNNKLIHPKGVSLAYLNINSMQNNFSSIPHLIDNNLDIFAIAETKLDSSFPESHFYLPGMRMHFRFNVTSRKSRLLVFVNNDIPSKYFRNFHLSGDIQVISLDINLKQRKLLVVSIYRATLQNLDYFLSSITGLLNHYLSLTKILS